jgi:hypothetical protein
MGSFSSPNRHQVIQLRKGNTEATHPLQTSIGHTTTRPQLLYPVDEVQNLSPEDFLSQSPYVSVTPSPALEWGELQAQDLSYLSTSSRSDFNLQMPYSSSPTTSDAGFTTASTATSAPMSRSNTNDVLCEQLGMVRVDSSFSQCDASVMSDTTAVDTYKTDSFMFHDSSFSSLEDSNVSQSQSLFLNTQSYVPSHSHMEMKRSPSQESESSLSSSSSQGSQSRMSRRVHEQNAQSKVRPLAPKTESHVNSPSAEAKMPKIVEVKSDDGTVRHKAEIPRTTRQHPPRKNTFCIMCSDHPQGFHGDHELRRHIERHHTTYRKVWICKDNSESGGPRPAVPLVNCKACRNHKTYGANYNAAAHLRRAHFYPCKNKRGGRGKVSEHRGGMGGGEEPPMEELKNWMFEQVEVNVAGNLPPSTAPQLSQLDTDMITDYSPFDETATYNNLVINLSPDPTQSYDWSNAQYSADLVGEPYQIMNSTNALVDQNFILASQHHSPTFDTPYLQ